LALNALSSLHVAPAGHTIGGVVQLGVPVTGLTRPTSVHVVVVVVEADAPGAITSSVPAANTAASNSMYLRILPP
jgi:hypothetical protein